jgi:rubrerythrin
MKVLTCKNCGYEWAARTETPWKCPRCQKPINPKRAEQKKVTQ